MKQAHTKLKSKHDILEISHIPKYSNQPTLFAPYNGLLYELSPNNLPKNI